MKPKSATAFAPPDRCQAPFVAVFKWLGFRSARKFVQDRSARVGALLHRDLGYTRQGFSIFAHARREVADDKNFRVAFDGQIGLDRDSSPTRGGNTGCFGQRLAKWHSSNTRSPKVLCGWERLLPNYLL